MSSQRLQGYRFALYSSPRVGRLTTRGDVAAFLEMLGAAVAPLSEQTTHLLVSPGQRSKAADKLIAKGARIAYLDTEALVELLRIDRDALLELLAHDPAAARQLIADASHAGLPLPALSGADLSGCDLAGTSLRGVDLEEANLEGAKLDGAALGDNGATLAGACFDHASLRDVSFGECDLTAASFRGADLRRASFEGTCLDRADFSGAAVDGTQFFGDISFEGARLSGLDLASCELLHIAGADLRAASLRGWRSPIHLPRCDLRGADLRDANLVGSDLNGARFEGANLRGTRLDFALFDRQAIALAIDVLLPDEPTVGSIGPRARELRERLEDSAWPMSIESRINLEDGQVTLRIRRDGDAYCVSWQLSTLRGDNWGRMTGSYEEVLLAVARRFFAGASLEDVAIEADARKELTKLARQAWQELLPSSRSRAEPTIADPSPDEEQLLATLRDNPDDAQTWLVLGDLLQERGDLRGQLIQLEHQLRGLAERCRVEALEQRYRAPLAGELPRYVLQCRKEALEQRYRALLLGELARYKDLHVQWRYGFIDSVSIPSRSALKIINMLRGHRLAPFIGEVWLSTGNAAAVEALVELFADRPLKKLTISSRAFSNAAPLARLTSLVELGLGAAGVVDVSPLRHLTNLERLFLGGGVRDLSPLYGLTRLKQLWTSSPLDPEQLRKLSEALPGLKIQL